MYDKVDEVFYANGAAVTIKMRALKKMCPGKVELFDSDFFFAYEDVDLSWKMRLAGYKTVVSSRLYCLSPEEYNYLSKTR